MPVLSALALQFSLTRLAPSTCALPPEGADGAADPSVRQEGGNRVSACRADLRNEPDRQHRSEFGSSGADLPVSARPEQSAIERLAAEVQQRRRRTGSG